MELSWDIQDEMGIRRDCDDGPGEPLGSVQLRGQRLDASGTFASDEWECHRPDHHAVTKFEIAEGRWAFDLLVLCQDFRLADVRVPDPIVRDVRDGEVVQLNALLIVVQDGTGSCPI